MIVRSCDLIIVKDAQLFSRGFPGDSQAVSSDLRSWEIEYDDFLRTLHGVLWLAGISCNPKSLENK
jgi:hypothetical protein